MDKYYSKGSIEMKRWELLGRIREVEFAAVDLNLFLDNHPENQQALDEYNKFVRELRGLKEKYVEEYGPLTNFGYCESKYPWMWVNEPWPWESGE